MSDLWCKIFQSMTEQPVSASDGAVSSKLKHFILEENLLRLGKSLWKGILIKRVAFKLCEELQDHRFPAFWSMLPWAFYQCSYSLNHPCCIYLLTHIPAMVKPLLHSVRLGWNCCFSGLLGPYQEWIGSCHLGKVWEDSGGKYVTVEFMESVWGSKISSCYMFSW